MTEEFQMTLNARSSKGALVTDIKIPFDLKSPQINDYQVVAEFSDYLRIAVIDPRGWLVIDDLNSVLQSVKTLEEARSICLSLLPGYRNHYTT